MKALTIDVCKAKRFNFDVDSYREVLDFLLQEGYTHLGWLNDGIKPPDAISFETQGINRSGSTCLMVNHDYKVMYSVDMGD